MRSLALLAVVALAGGPPGAPAAVAEVADALAERIGAPAEGRRALALAVEAEGSALAQPLESALDAALARRGWAVSPLRGEPDPEARARADGAAWLLRVRGGLVPGGREVAIVGDLVPTWTSFFLQRRPAARPASPVFVQARVAADPETLLLGRPRRPPDAARVGVRTIARVPGRVLALAIGDAVGGGAPAILAVTATEARLLSADGQPIAARALDAAGRRPVRDPAAAAAIGDFGGGRIALEVAGAPQGEVLAVRGGRLETVAPLEAAPLCAGAAGALFGQFAPGKGVLADVLERGVDAGARPRSARERVAVAASPRGGAIAYGALGTDGRLELLGSDLAPVGAPLDGIGAGFALADLDGDGTAEVIASSGVPGAPERIRVLVPRAPFRVAFESAPVAGAILAGAGGDLTGDGIDDAVLGAVVTAEDGAVETQLLLVTADPREVP